MASIKSIGEECARVAGGLEVFIARAENDGDQRLADSYRWARTEALGRNLQPMNCLRQLDPDRGFPVSIDQFLDDPDFLGYLKGEFGVWEAHHGLVRDMNPDVMCGAPPIIETALGGASGTGKTTLAWINMAYQFYLLTCFRNPQRLFGLGPMTPVVFTIQSIKQSITKLVIYEPLRVMLTSMPYMKRWCSWDKQREKSSLDFDNGVHILPVLARSVSLQGQAVIGGILDELSFMVVIESSKQVAGPRGLGGKFDQAEEVYTQTTNRRSRSFSSAGISIGSVCSLSNTSYRDDFMDRHLAFIEEHKPDKVIARRLRRYEVHPGDMRAVKAGKVITIQVGSDYHSTMVIREGEEPDKGAQTIEVPAKYLLDFMYDGDKALREVAGIASAAIRPFLRERNKLANAFKRGEEMGLVPWTDVTNADLSTHGMPNWLPNVLAALSDKHVLRYIHVDLSKSRDRCGIAVIKPFGLINVDMPDGKVKTVPCYAIEVAISLTPSGNAEVEPAVIRDWLLRLSNEHGVQIGGISYDGYQSQESLQVLRRARVHAKEISVDRNMEPYEYFRSALYEARIAACPSDLLMEELVMLEYNSEKDKVDHPPKGSKDVADAVVGAIFNCSNQRSWRTQTGFYDKEGEKVRAKGDGTAKRPRSIRPAGGKRKRKRTRARKREDIWDIRPAQQERELPEEVAEADEIVAPPPGWLDQHGS